MTVSRQGHKVRRRRAPGRVVHVSAPRGRPARQAAAETAARGTEADVIAEVNAEGRLCVQIGVVAFAWDPFTSRPMSGLQQILDWLDSWGIPREWPAGQPAA